MNRKIKMTLEWRKNLYGRQKTEKVKKEVETPITTGSSNLGTDMTEDHRRTITKELMLSSNVDEETK
jgi:hypothetical protein